MSENTKVYVFDVDGTLTRPFSLMDEEMGRLMVGLLHQGKKIAILSGADMHNVKKQCGSFLDLALRDGMLANVLIAPVSGARCYCFIGGPRSHWRKLYDFGLGSGEALSALVAINNALIANRYNERLAAFLKAENLHERSSKWGSIIMDRGAQITFSALGEDSPSKYRLAWDKDGSWRNLVVESIRKAVGDKFDVRSSGSNSVDVNAKGINKGLGIRQIAKLFEVLIGEMRFVGDGIFPGGNDYPIVETGVPYNQVSNPNQTKILIRDWL